MQKRRNSIVLTHRYDLLYLHFYNSGPTYATPISQYTINQAFHWSFVFGSHNQLFFIKLQTHQMTCGKQILSHLNYAFLPNTIDRPLSIGVVLTLSIFYLFLSLQNNVIENCVQQGLVWYVLLKGLRPVLEGFVVPMHEGACETGSQIPRA